jgi:hypothetical protein
MGTCRACVIDLKNNLFIYIIPGVPNAAYALGPESGLPTQNNNDIKMFVFIKLQRVWYIWFIILYEEIQ